MVSKHILRYSFFWIVLICPKFIFAQKALQSFKLVDAVNGNPIVAASVEVEESSMYTFTNEDGIFQLDLRTELNKVRISYLGYKVENLILQKTTPSNGLHIIKMHPLNLALEELIVLAENNTDLVTTSKIGSAALEHLQSVSLADIMQLLPGGLIENPDLSSPQQIKMREISSNANSALGTAIIIDGNPLNNDANLQTASTTQVGTHTNNVSQAYMVKFVTTSGSGVDLRQISTNNIESVEVIRGIPSVQYGNVTSGAIVVNTKAGATPLELKFKTDPFVKQLYLGKGIQLKRNAGAVNVSLDYLSSYADVLSKYDGYDRLNGQVGYYKVFMPTITPLTFNMKINVHSTIDEDRTDPDAMVPNEIYRSSNQGANFSMKGKWYLNKPIITGLRYILAGSVAHQESYQKAYKVGNQQGTSISLEPGENYGVVLPTERLTEYTVDGKPYQLFGQLSAYKSHHFGHHSINRVTMGVDYRLSGNKGLGQIYDMTNPPYVSTTAIRPRSYKDIPPVSTIAFYMEDKMTLNIGTTSLEVEAGVRLNNYQPKGDLSSNIGFFAEPRGNIRYSIIRNANKKVKLLDFRLGAGRLYKVPPLLYMYPNMAYVDLQSLLHYTTNVDTRTVVYTTHVFDSKNSNLKLMENNKFEVGIDFKIGKISGVLTAFHEKSKDGVGFTKKFQFLEYKKYDNSSVPEGEIPDISKLPYTTHASIAQYKVPINMKNATKQGVEYTFSLDKIPAISTQFVIDGAWLKTFRNYQSVPYNDQPGAIANAYNWVATYEGGNGKVEERLHSTLRLITHLPKIAMVFTSSVQVTWYEKYYYPYYNGTPLYLFNETETIPFTDEMKDDPEFRAFVKESSPEYFKEEIFPTLVMVNFRLSKEIGKSIKLSFYANNFLNYRPKYLQTRGGKYVRRNQPVYFGADIQFRL